PCGAFWTLRFYGARRLAPWGAGADRGGLSICGAAVLPGANLPRTLRRRSAPLADFLVAGAHRDLPDHDPLCTSKTRGAGGLGWAAPNCHPSSSRPRPLAKGGRVRGGDPTLRSTRLRFLA